MTTQSRSSIMASIHETAEGLYEADLLDKQTMHEFDERRLTPVQPLTPNQIRHIRERENVSQTIFARYLNVNKNSVSQWERGEKSPSGAALKLLSLVEKKGLSAIA
jgi:putative transcriptional regulator